MLSIACEGLAQTVSVTPHTSSTSYHKTTRSGKTTYEESYSASTSIRQDGYTGKESYGYGTSADGTKKGRRTVMTASGYGTKTADNISLTYPDIEIPVTSTKVKSQVITHVGYTISYNSHWLIPNWVAYCLTAEEVAGTFPRPKRAFEPDPQVKGKSAEHRDYSNSGYSRGHMAPAADMKWSEQAMSESFYLTNICPQTPELNAGVWERLEKRCRALAGESDLYICCGPLMSKAPERIGENGVAVPTGFYKVLCMRRNGKWQAIGFMFPNTACKGSMFDFSCSVDDVEKTTGHDFFHTLPNDIEKSIESSYVIKDWR